MYLLIQVHDKLQDAVPTMPSRPAVPVRGYSFGDFSTSAPASQQPGQRIDQELDRLATTIDELIDWTATVLADAGGIKPGVTAPSGPAGLVWTGDWSSSTAYAVNDAVAYGGSSWICIQAHTNQTPTSGAYWNLVAQKGADSSATSIQDVTVTSSSSALTVTNNGTGSALILSAAAGAGLVSKADTNGVAKDGASAFSPSAIWTVSAHDTGNPASLPADTTQHQVGAAATTNRQLLDSFAASSHITGRRANGSLASPSALAADDTIIALSSLGYGSAYVSTVRAAYSQKAAETWSGSAHGTYHQWSVTFPTSTTTFDAMRLDALTASTAKLTVTGRFEATLGLDVRTSGSDTAEAILASPAGIERRFKFQTATTDRWSIRMSTTSESGANAGADLTVRRYSDAGASLGDALTINRATGVVDFATAPTVGGSAIGVAVPTGAVLWVAATSAPTGYLKCNGAAISRTTYSALFAAIGTTFGAGDGSTTFNVPDLRGEFVRGYDDGRGVDAARALGSSQSAAFASHTHSGSTSSDGAHTHTVTASNVSSFGSGVAGNAMVDDTNGSLSLTTSSSGSHSHSFTTGSAGGAETRPRNIALLGCIKI